MRADAPIFRRARIAASPRRVRRPRLAPSQVTEPASPASPASVPDSGPSDRIAVVVATYNQPRMLAAVLEGYLAQRDPGFELLVADDGSTGETAELVAAFARRAPFAVRHVWQEDRGFRLAASRNRAIAATAAGYVILTDGDCIPPSDFVAAHRRLREPGRFLGGNRILLREGFSRRVLDEGLPIHRWTARDWVAARRSGQVNRLLPLARVPLGPVRRLRGRNWPAARGCNISAYRSDLERVNGFDEAYEGWGMEDSDLAIRLIRAGVLYKSARLAAPLFHLWHREYDRSRLPENQRQLRELLESDRVRARRGLDRYAPPPPGR